MWLGLIPIPPDTHTSRGGRWDKSLGILCQKFLMLFLVAPVSPTPCDPQFTKVYNIFVSPLQKHELTLDKAGSILMPDEDHSVSNSKSKAELNLEMLQLNNRIH